MPPSLHACDVRPLSRDHPRPPAGCVLPAPASRDSGRDTRFKMPVVWWPGLQATIRSTLQQLGGRLPAKGRLGPWSQTAPVQLEEEARADWQCCW